jgi:predicted enzyme related to lactoylglutathione lyase
LRLPTLLVDYSPATIGGVPNVGIDRRSVIIGAATFAALRTAESTPPSTKETQVNSPTERVLGIGGLFFRSRNPEELKQWYQVHLGIDQPSWQQAAGPTAFNPFSMDTDYFGSPQQAWMVNFRVRNLDAMVAQLRKSNIEVKVDPENYPYGRFARLHDPEGNPIELWEPAGAS